MQALPLTERRGFSISESLGALTIFGMVAAAFLPHVTTSADIAKQKSHEQIKATIDEAVERFYINESRWPADDLSDIGADRNYFPEGVPVSPLSGRPYMLDPTSHRAE